MVEIEGYDVDAPDHMIVLDLDRLFEGVDLTPGELSSAICMSAPETPVCAPLFEGVGLDYEGGAAADASAFTLMTE